MHNVIDFIPRYYAFRLVALSSPRPSLAILSFVLSSLFYLSIRLFDSKRKVDSFAVKYRCLPGEFGRARNGMLLKNAWTRALFRGYFFRCALFYDRKIVMVWGLGNRCRWEVNFFMYTRVLSFLKNSCRSILTHFLFLFFDRSRYPRDIERLPLITQGTKFILSSRGRNEFLRPNMANVTHACMGSVRFQETRLAFHRLFPILPFKSAFNAGRKGLGEGRKAEREFHRITVMLTTRDGILMDRGRGSLQRNCLTGIYHGLRADIYVQWTGKVSLMFQRLFTLTYIRSPPPLSTTRTMQQRTISRDPGRLQRSRGRSEMSAFPISFPRFIRWHERNDASFFFAV